MLLLLSLLLLGAAIQAAPQGQSDCAYVDEDVCSTVEQEVCEDGLEWECDIQTRIEHVGKEVEVCDPTSKTVCVAKTRYEPEEYLDEECTTTTEQVCKTNYETKAVKFTAKECSTTYQKECTLKTEDAGVTTKTELQCTCEECTMVLEDGKCDKYNVCQKVLKPRCHTGPTRKTRSGCEKEECKTIEIHTKNPSQPKEHCTEKPTEYCQDVEKHKTEVVPVKDCNHIPTTDCKQVKKIRQKEIVYQECMEVTEKGCKFVHKYIEKPVDYKDCKGVTKEICSLKPKRECTTIKTQICGGH